jgi:TetR/AcrR family transcriptional regulator
VPTPLANPARRAPRLPAPERREHILDAAIAVFARVGYREAATAAIAVALGISEPTIFRYFPTKRALYLAAVDRSAEITMGHWREIATRSPSPLAALLQMGQWYFAELQRDSQHLRLRFRSYSEANDPEVGTRVREHVRTAFDFVLELYERARVAGEIAPETDVRAHTWLFVAIGALLDVTQILGMRADLPLEAMPAIMTLAAPRHGRGPLPEK